MKKTIGVVFGGRSVEHDVSIITAHNPIIDSLLATKKYEVVPIYIAKDGSWYSDPKMNDINYFRNDLDEKLKKLRPVSLLMKGGSLIMSCPDSSVLSMVVTPWATKIKKIDVVFPAMHGTFGEDGSLMGLLRMAGVPFVGCDIFASSVAMDKILTKQVLRAEGLPTVRDVWFMKSDFEANKQKYLTEINKLRYPLFVKPVHLGSSIGMSKVKNEAELINGIEVAFHYDEKVLVEEGVQNLIEVTLPIMGNENPVTAHVEKPLNKGEFFDYTEKYMKGGKKTGGVNSEYSEIPANIGEELTEKVRELGKTVYKVLGCSGIARVDFLIDGETRQIYVNEVNTLPGSLYQHNWKKMGISNIELVERLIGYARERFEKQTATNFVFSSGILNQYKGTKS